MSSIIIILRDQLSTSISSLSKYNNKNDIILMNENWHDLNNVAHHKKKIIFLLSAMRHFHKSITKKNCNTEYIKIDKENISLKDSIKRLLNNNNYSRIIIAMPSEFSLFDEINTQWREEFNIPIEITPDNRFLCNIDEFKKWANDKKNLRMEFFYRDMRKKLSILMDNNKPVGDKWNFDKENRKPPKKGLHIPEKYISEPDKITKEVIDIVNIKFKNNFGDSEPFHFAVTRQHALIALDKFITERLSNFGDYQDAMIQNEPWMYHSHLSFYLNSGLLLPLECIEIAEKSYRNNSSPINAVEGFIRQILGWREYIRGIYWLKMPEYFNENFFDARRKLPKLFWTGETKMNCLHQCIEETKQNAYAHHIQRLMVLGNFALLAGIDPSDVNYWFLVVYADAYEWVELPNVTGMILFADGGFLASKPYAAGGGYINKMSDYCKNCEFKVSKKVGDDACPFNYLYWNFLIKNKEALSSNHRMSMMYKILEKMDKKNIDNIMTDSDNFLNKL